MITIDCISDPCPLPIIKAERRLRKMSTGDEICILTNHNCAFHGIPEWARKKGYQVRVEETPHNEWKIYIEKTYKKDSLQK